MTPADPMLEAYLARIGLTMPLQADLESLQALHRAQGMTVPYESIDVFTGQPVTQDIGAIQRKIIEGQRGGWCYETNGLLAWALGRLGFQVRRAMAAAYNHQMAEDSLGNHVVVIVTLDEVDWLCDLGLGDALRAPIPMHEGLHHDGPLTFRMERLEDGTFRFWNHAAGDPSNFVVDPGPADEARIARKHAQLLADPASSFRQNFQVMQMKASGSTVIYGRVLRRTTPEGVTKTLIEGPEALERLLDAEFGLRGIAVEPLWPRILARHAAVFGDPEAQPD
ncbi:arylamine N-acetyltransferase [Tabrizicola sp. J26]|uniref:arylamine N-acetyltransferase family protein n=1 Tax=Alitabrizicola rongguiensis TaxID=2909234 RepID=UPI001F318FF5|nr:arylamine N-acetyltransferase [Tabrizicola rongguiensis]MCF1709797.1 arylamine N-acetyltransferase [Tabrizicola rongguiensis]